MIFVVVPMVGNNAIRASGDMKTPALIMFIAALINAILDPLLIFGIGFFPRLEIAGAALATVTGRAVTLVISLYILFHREKMIGCAITSLKSILRSWGQILYIAIPSAATRIVLPIGIGVITRLLSTYGAETVAAYGVASRIEFFTLAVIMALSSVLGPVVGQNWGAKRYSRVSAAMHLSNRFSLLWGVFIYIVLFFAAHTLASLFNSNPAVLRTVTLYLHIAPIGYGFYGIIILTGSVLNVLRKPIHAALLTILQMFILYVPLALLGSTYFGLKGIFAALVVSCFIAGTVALIVITRTISSLRTAEQAGRADETAK